MPDEQWDGLKSNPLVRDLIGRCADLEAAMLLDDQTLAAELPISRIASLKSAVDARLLLAA